ncbi:MAG: YjgP/YjgQ family permease [Bacteroidetes bacterium]|nr:MAG: YjgP/YjgQ family permease [Bacteroidota bacterium]
MMNRIKILDRLLIKSFLPPFAVTFFIALFVFVMQTLWLYIDEIAGKGVGFFLMVELVAYLSVSMIPMALPVAVLISSVMVLGNMAERYELSSMKSAGISLWRTMRPLMILTMGISVFSFFCSNYFIPVSNLKFKSRLYDIRRQKPTLSLEESTFNDDFQGYSIRIGDKLPDNQTIRNVLLYDDQSAGQGRLLAVMADSGQMYGSADGKYFVMHFFNGHQYLEPKPVLKEGKRNKPFMRAKFEEWTKVFDLDEFELDRTDEALFKSHYSMLSNRQLAQAIDSIDRDIAQRIAKNAEQVQRQYYLLEKRLNDQLRQQRFEENRKRDLMNSLTTIPDSIPAADSRNKQAGKLLSQDRKGLPPITDKQPDTLEKKVRVFDLSDKDFNPAVYSSFIESLPKQLRTEYLGKAKMSIKSVLDQSLNLQSNLKRIRENRVKYVFEFHSKFSFALACFIFLFVGAPMGAIVRKGGFGWPLLISIVFFMLFIIISIFSKNIAERFVIEATPAAWMNCMIIFPMGLLLTFWAMRDQSLQQIADSLIPTNWKWWRKAE